MPAKTHRLGRARTFRSGHPMRALIAFDKFKDALTADEACRTAARTLRSLHPEWSVEECPLTDGGEGFAPILTRAAGGSLEHIRVDGPRGAAVEAGFGLVRLNRLPADARAILDLPPELPADAILALVEMAAASGLALLAPEARDPWRTTTTGTGQLIAAATACGASAILLGLGGSATSDLGLGALAALGLEFFSATGERIHPPEPAEWARIARIGGRLRSDLPPLRIACDVANPLLGPRGCAAVYGPQKGLRAGDVDLLDAAGARLARMLCAHTGAPEAFLEVPGAGAAGGIAFGLMAAAGARLLSGNALVQAWLDLDARIAAADLVLTGEGRFDASSLEGKGPGAVAARAAGLGRTTHLFAGAVTTAAALPFAAHAITPPGMPLAQALRATDELLAAAIRRHLP